MRFSLISGGSRGLTLYRSIAQTSAVDWES